MRRQLVPAILMFVALTLLTGVAYPMVVTAFAQVFPAKADGSFVKVDGKVVGSRLIGQNFAGASYFHPRPSNAGEDGYDGAASAGSNLGPTNQDLLDAVAERVAAYRTENSLPDSTAVPSDAVTSSGSGLDPEISIANARLQAPRVAKERDMAVDAVLRLVDRHTRGRTLGVFGDPGVNVLELNLALDAAAPAGP